MEEEERILALSEEQAAYELDACATMGLGAPRLEAEC